MWVTQTPTKEGDKVQVLTLPVMSSLDDISEESGNGTAPPRLGLTVTDPFHPSRQDIFENTLSTSCAEYFPIYTVSCKCSQVEYCTICFIVALPFARNEMSSVRL